MKPPEKKPNPLQGRRAGHASPARETALAVLNAVRNGSFTEQALWQTLESQNLSSEDRALATEIVYGVVRWRYRLDSILDRCLADPRKKLRPQLREILRMALYQLVMLDRIPSRAAVNEAVIQARARFDQRTGSLANAVLRNALRNWNEVDPTPGHDAQSLAVYYSHPLWLVEKWLKEWGPDLTRTILSHNNSRTTLVIRANRIKTTREDLLSFLLSSEMDARPTIPEPDALLVNARRPVHRIPGFQEGLFAVQDSASQMVAPLLKVQPGERILDACAAPGGKTAHLAALAGNEAEITAMDSDAARLDEARQNLSRLGCKGITFLQGNARSPNLLKDFGLFDKILLDPPCSNLGVLRHNPEIKYRIAAQDLGQFSRAQLQTLRGVAPLLKPGGTMVLSVCTVTAEETVEVAQKFLDLCPQFSVDPILPSEVPSSRFTNARGCLATFPPTGPEPVDGFFAVRLIKS